jgi:hypothetical protein
MKYNRSDITAHEVRLVNDGAVIGHVTQIQRSHVYDVWVGFAHDWDGECTVGDEYDPISIGVFDDPDSAYAEIERRAREAQAPASLAEGPNVDYSAEDAAQFEVHGDSPGELIETEGYREYRQDMGFAR